jgi:hypothetical protein
VHEEHNALHESIDKDDVLSLQDIGHQVLTDLRVVFSHAFSSIIGDPKEDIRIKSKINKNIVDYAFVSQLESKFFKDINNDSN